MRRRGPGVLPEPSTHRAGLSGVKRITGVRRAVGLAVVVAPLAMLLATSGAEAKGGSKFFGLNWSAHHDRDWSEKDARKLRESGAKTVRWSMFWARIERSPGQFDWSTQDKVVGDLAAKGIKVLPILSGTPSWLADSPSKPPLDSKKERDAWKEYLREAVKRYGPQGAYWGGPYQADHPGKSARPITIWQVWNEPNLVSHWKPHPSPSGYAHLLELSHKAIEDASPRAKVMFAGMPGYSIQINAWDFLRSVYHQHGARNAFDIAALHPYSHNPRQMLHSVKHMRKVMHKQGDGHKPLWITEIGWGSLPKNATPYHLTKGRKGQARILKRSFHALQKKRHRWHIGRVLWFNFRDPRGGSGQGCAFCSSAGLLENDFTPKPSWSAFRSFTH
jgi:polysaccharide biosynthesis protein PslG